MNELCKAYINTFHEQWLSNYLLVDPVSYKHHFPMLPYWSASQHIGLYADTQIISKPNTAYSLTGLWETPGGDSGNAPKVSSPLFPGELLLVNKVVFHSRCVYLNSTLLRTQLLVLLSFIKKRKIFKQLGLSVLQYSRSNWKHGYCSWLRRRKTASPLLELKGQCKPPHICRDAYLCTRSIQNQTIIVEELFSTPLSLAVSSVLKT